MKKVEKRQAEEFLDLMEQAHSEIRKSLDKKDIPMAMTLLADCQDGAISLGNLIEATEGEGFVTIALLEEYCELAYQLYESLAGEEGIEVGKVYKPLRNKLVKIRNSVRNDIKVRKEVVFLPYKASMWDSLESVWRAADQDPDCDAYVVPIPYYDKNPDGSFREMHYEGNLYPKDVPVMWYKDYDFAKRRPDVIFIHNPYDEYNYVTSVHPDFYSGKLKEYTEKLVYIPYFVLDEIDPHNEAAVKEMEHFVTHPGVINADRVIVQSENMRQIYIDVMSRHAGEHTRKIWEKKILGLGSPKFDKVLNTKKEDLEIPQEWLKIIKKADGNFKKIVFYNTSVTGLLQYDEKMLKKLKAVFKAFHENKEEIALLWRPHPLIEATISSMRPQLWAEYQKLVREYKEAGWGIYDDSADLDRAIILSDAYYGGGSSVVQLYSRTKKLIVLQESDVPDQGNRRIIPNDGMYSENDTLWFVGNRDNILYKMQMPYMKTECVALLPQKNNDSYSIYPRCIKKDNYLYCIPDRGSNIQVYDIIGDKFEQIEIPNPRKQRICIVNFWMTDSLLWCVSNTLNQLIVLDVKKKTTEKVYNLFDAATDSMGYEAAKENNEIFYVSTSSTILGVYDIQTRTKKKYKLPACDKGFNTIAVEGDEIYLTGYKRAVYCWNKENNNMDIYEIPTDFFENGDALNESGSPRFYKTIILEGKIVFIPLNTTELPSKKILCMDKKNKSLKAIDLSGEGNKIKTGHIVVDYVRGDLIGICDANEDRFIEVNVNTNEVISKEMRLDKETKIDFLLKRLNERRVWQECNLEFIQFLRRIGV